MGFDFTVWATIATMHAVAVASPGPDFAIVLKQSLQQGRKLAMITSLGIGVGILVHVAYSILGIGLLIQANEWVFQALLYAAAGYLIYLGLGAIRSSSTANTNTGLGRPALMSGKKAFSIGFITNGLNPKATLFFLSLFSLAIPAQTQLSTKIIYGVYLAIATAAWFILLSYLVSNKQIREIYQKKGYWFDRIMGAVIILMAVMLLLSN